MKIAVQNAVTELKSLDTSVLHAVLQYRKNSKYLRIDNQLILISYSTMISYSSIRIKLTIPLH